MGGGQRILLAEDHRSTREGLAEFLRLEGYRVDAVIDGEEALAACSADPPDLLITDLDMPRLRGESLIRWLRANHPETEVAVITGETTGDAGMRAAALGVTCYLTKPLNLEEVAQRVRAVLTRPSPTSTAPL